MVDKFHRFRSLGATAVVFRSVAQVTKTRGEQYSIARHRVLLSRDDDHGTYSK